MPSVPNMPPPASAAQNLPREPFVPFASGGNVARPSVSEVTPGAIPPPPRAAPSEAMARERAISSLLPDLSGAATGPAKPQISLQRENGRVTRIIVHCSCGERIELALVS
jgi:hypothetical protein